MRLNQINAPTPLEYKQLIGTNHVSSFQKNEKPTGWYTATVIRILSNRIYIGALEQGKTKNVLLYDGKKLVLSQKQWTIKKNAHEAIVSKECFDAVGRLLRIDTRNASGE